MVGRSILRHGKHVITTDKTNFLASLTRFLFFLVSFATLSYSQEVAQFQNRLNRNMQECQEKARDMITPGTQNDSRAMSRVETALITCMEKQVHEHIQLLKPMKERCVLDIDTRGYRYCVLLFFDVFDSVGLFRFVAFTTFSPIHSANRRLQYF